MATPTNAPAPTLDAEFPVEPVGVRVASEVELAAVGTLLTVIRPVAAVAVEPTEAVRDALATPDTDALAPGVEKNTDCEPDAVASGRLAVPVALTPTEVAAPAAPDTVKLETGSPACAHPSSSSSSAAWAWARMDAEGVPSE